MLYKLTILIFKLYYSAFYQRGKHNTERIPENGALILCANHRYWNDPFFLALSVKRPVHFLAKKDLFNTRFKRWLMERLNAIPVSRDGNDVYSLKKSYEVLKEENVLCIFPEGTRNKTNLELMNFKPGIAALAIRTKTKIMPAYIRNEHKYFGNVDVFFGEPFELSEYYDKKLSNAEYAEIANSVIAEKIRAIMHETEMGEKCTK